MAKKDFSGATLDYTEAIKLNPEKTVYNERGIAKEEKGDIDGAIADFDESIRLDPDFSNPYSNRALSYGKKGMLTGNKSYYEKAMNDLNKAISLNPILGHAYTRRGIMKFYTGIKEGGVQDMIKGLSLGHIEAYKEINKLANWRGITQKDVDELKKLLNHENKKIADSVKKILKKMGKY